MLVESNATPQYTASLVHCKKSKHFSWTEELRSRIVRWRCCVVAACMAIWPQQPGLSGTSHSGEFNTWRQELR